MADNTMDNLLAEMKKQGTAEAERTNFLAKSDEEQKLAFNELKNGFMKELGVSNDIAEEMVNAYLDSAKDANKVQEYQMAADKMAQMRGQAQLGKLDELKTVMGTKLGDLGTALSDDFKQITGGLSMIAEAPGIKSLVAIVTTIASSLGTLVLLSLKRNLSEDNFFGKRIATNDKGGVDMMQTLKNFNPLAGVMTPGDPKEPKQKWKNANRDEKGQFKKMNMVDEFKFTFGNAMSDANEKMKESLKESGKKLWESTEGLRDNAFTRGLSKVGKTMAAAGKRLLTGAVRLAASSLAFIAGLAASAVSMLLAAAPLLLKAALIGLIVAGLIFIGMYVYKKFMENKDYIMAKWQQISEGFGIVMDQLVLWKDKAVTFLSNTFKSIWLGLKSLFATVMTGLENGINMAIKGINKLIPGEQWDLDPVDIGAGEFRREVDEEKAAFEVEKANEAAELAARQKDIDDRKAANTMDKHMANNVIQQNTTVNEGSKETTIVPTGTDPQDSFAGNMALAQ